MSDPRMIPADEAKRLREAATPGPWEKFHDEWEEFDDAGEEVAEYAQSGVIGRNDGILDTHPRRSLMDAPNQWNDGEDHDNRANTALAAAAPDLAHTVVEQAEQIKRLQEAVRTLLAGLNEAELEIYQEYETFSTPPFKPHTLDEYITAEDMEDAHE